LYLLSTIIGAQIGILCSTYLCTTNKGIPY
jgi:hypothetical protein